MEFPEFALPEGLLRPFFLRARLVVVVRDLVYALPSPSVFFLSLMPLAVVRALPFSSTKTWGYSVSD